MFGCLPNGFYGLDTMLIEGVLRALAGQPRAEGSTRIDPHAFGRVLGLDRGPEVKTIRAKITTLAATGRADELLAAMAATHVTRLDASNPDLLAVFYVDGHVRAYQGAHKIAKTHLSCLSLSRSFRALAAHTGRGRRDMPGTSTASQVATPARRRPRAWPRP